MTINGIDTKDISVVVQGAIDKKITPKCLKSIRKYLPEAEIILSTWAGSDVSGLDYDVVVLSKDPGSDGSVFYYVGGYVTSNLSRQIVSTQRGLEKCTRAYVVKMRTDFFLTGNGFLKYYDKFNFREKAYSIFNHRVIVASVFSRMFSEATGFPMPYHPGDFFFFGERQDVQDYFFGTQLPAKNSICYYHCKYQERIPFPGNNLKFAPEQYLCTEWLKRNNVSTKFSDWTDWNFENIEMSNNYLFSNFIFLDYKQLGLDSEKHKYNLRHAYDKNFYGLITFAFFVNEYNKRFKNSTDFYKDSNMCENLIEKTTKIKAAKRMCKKLVKIVLSPVRPFVRVLKVFCRYLYRFVKWC